MPKGFLSGEIVLVFSSNVFLFAYLPAVLLLYYICPRRGRNLLLFAVSLVFYGWGEPVYLALMLFTIALNYAGGLMIDSRRRSGKSAKTVLTVTIVLNLALPCRSVGHRLAAAYASHLQSQLRRSPAPAPAWVQP